MIDQTGRPISLPRASANGRRWIVRTLLLLIVTGPLGCQRPAHRSLVNFAHLDHLTERIDLVGEKVDIVHIYANYPDYAWVSAKESGPEGIACVDDAARAAVLYLRDFEINRRYESLRRARGLLEFILAMQAPDGQFWNFIFEDHSVNREGKTSFKSFGWWAARGLWSLGHGYRVFKEADSAFAAQLGRAFERSLPHIHLLLKNYDDVEEEGGFRMPCWLLYGSGADATSEMLLGLVEFYRAAPSAELREMIVRLAHGFAVMQDGDIAKHPFGLHRSWRTLWHMWGNSQTQALAMAGRVLGDSSMVVSARREAEGFYTRLLCEGFFHEMDLRTPENRKVYGQIAYGVRPMTVGLIRLYEATGNADYLRLAGLSASWLFGNNPAGIAMYDSITGRCFDGINSATEVNRNSGAESTIEALLTIVELEAYPEALQYARSRRVEGESSQEGIRAVFESSGGERLTLHVDPPRQQFRFE